MCVYACVNGVRVFMLFFVERKVASEFVVIVFAATKGSRWRRLTEQKTKLVVMVALVVHRWESQIERRGYSAPPGNNLLASYTCRN
jgi:hypothetical protein